VRLGSVGSKSDCYSTFHAPPYSVALVIEFSIEGGRLTRVFRVYPIVTDNTITDYQPRFVSDDEFNNIYDLLKEPSHWNAAESGEVKRGQDDIGRYIKFSHSAR
jgi:hypothetical protein